MIAFAPTPPRRSTLAAEGDRAYVGYRWPGVATAVRLPSGEHVAFRAGADPALAEAVLADRLGHPPQPALLEVFRREWVRPRAHGEFVWPVAAVDEWLAAAATEAAALASPSRRRGAGAEPRRALDSVRRALRSPLVSAHSPTTPSPPGGH